MADFNSVCVVVKFVYTENVCKEKLANITGTYTVITGKPETFTKTEMKFTIITGKQRVRSKESVLYDNKSCGINLVIITK